MNLKAPQRSAQIRLWAENIL